MGALPKKKSEVEILLETVRFSTNPEQRREALAQLEKFGMVESLGEVPELSRETPLPIEEKEITPTRTKPGYRFWFITACIIGFTILVIILIFLDSTSCLPILRIKDANYYQRAGRCNFNQSKYEKAFIAYEKGLELDPEDQILRQELANRYDQRATIILLDGKHYDQARAFYTRAIELNPNVPEYYMRRGQLYYSMSDFDHAVADFDLAIKLDPRNSEAFELRGWSNIGNGEYDSAIDDFNQMMKIEPESAGSYYCLGVAYTEKGEYDRAITEFDKSIELLPSFSQAYIGRGRAYAEKGDSEQAETNFKRAIEIDPNDAVTQNNLAWTLAYYLDIDYERALSHALRSVELESDCYNQDTLGLVYYKLGRYEEALEHYTLALSLDSYSCVETYKRRGDVYLTLDNDQMALADYQEYLTRKPDALDREEVEEIIQSLK